jgi:hypothetical protein
MRVMKTILQGFIGWQAMIKCAISMVILFFALFSCRHNASKKDVPREKKQDKQEIKTKPSSSFSDTLIISSRSAVFYYPDSLQLEKIKEVTDKNIFESFLHDYYYQVRFGHLVLKEQWPGINIEEARNVRYLLFLKKDTIPECIDLDTKNDAYGLFVFDPLKKPVQVDLTNAESEIGFYFNDNN